MIKFFTSLTTSLWVMGLSMIVYALGSFLIPRHLDIFSEINDMPLFSWLSANRGEMGVSYWIPSLMVLMAFLAVNILVCGYDSLVRGLRGGGYIETLAPQFLHLGVVLVLFGHLVSASAGYKEDVSVGFDGPQVFRGHRLELISLDFLKVSGEDSTRWRVGLVVDGQKAILEPARPLFFDRTGYFAKSASQKKERALIGIVYDPGVAWEIAGAVLFVLGGAGLVLAQFRKAG
jgi:cytochrome c biogenesis factor